MRNIEDIYPLTPMQQVMLLHSVGNPLSRELTTQIVIKLDLDADVSRLSQAWEKVVAKHASLRTGFYWAGKKEPVQFVRQAALPEIYAHKLSDDQERFDAEKERLINEDRNMAFDLSKAPLMRVTYLCSPTIKNIMIWTSHHLVLDRWCTSIVLNDLKKFYADGDNQSASSVRTSASAKYKTHIEHIRRISTQETSAYWRKYLHNWRPRNPLLSLKSSSSAESDHISPVIKQEFKLPANATLSTIAKKWNTTSAQLAQLAWGITLNQLYDSADSVYALTVSGRSADINGVENIVGCFINNVPTRSRILPNTTIRSYLELLSSDQWDRERYQHESLSKISSLIQSSESAAIESLFVWLSDLGLPNEDKEALSLELEEQSMASAFPMTVGVLETNNCVGVNISINPEFQSRVSIAEIIEIFENTIGRLVTSQLTDELQSVIGFDAIAETVHENDDSEPNDFLFQQVETVVDGRSGGRAASDPVLTRQLIVNEWKSVLNLDAIDESKSFFELGGTSIDAAKLHAKLQGALRSSLPLLQLYQKPYIEDMLALFISGDLAMHDQIAIPVKESGKYAPLFFVASPDVNTIGCAQLANYIKSDRPVVVLQAPPSSERMQALSPRQLPEVAEQYIQAMQAIQPNGPYNLMGMCTGAQLSFEMAKQLKESKEHCSFLGILNTWALYTVSRTYRLQQLFTRFKVLQQEKLIDQPAVVWEKILVKRIWNPLKARLSTKSSAQELAMSANDGISTSDTTASMEGLVGASVAKNDITPPSEKPVDEWVHAVGWHHKFKPKPKLEQHVVVVRTNSQPFWRIKNSNLGWDLHAESVEVETLKCDDHHVLLREPWVAELASVIDSKLVDTPMAPDSGAH